MYSVQGLHVVPPEEKLIWQARLDHRDHLSFRGLHLEYLSPCLLSRATSSHLTELDLSFNSLLVLPNTLHEATQLRSLLAHHNRLQQLPSCIGKLRELRKLDVSHNEITHIPAALSQLDHLQDVNFSGNRITVLQPDVFQPKSLRTLFVSRNPIQNVPQNVYVYGLQAIRQYFCIDQPIAVSPSEQVFERDSLCKLLAQAKLRPVPIKENSKERSNCDRFEQGMHNQSVQMVEMLFKPKQVVDLLGLERHGSTSDYGSCASSNVGSQSDHLRDAFDVGDNDSCHGDCGSDNGDIDISELDDRCEVCSQPLHEEIDFEKELVDCILPNRSRLLKQAQVAVIIPEHNKHNYMRSDFYLSIIEDLSFVPELNNGAVQASPVVSLGPHGAVFYEDSPAVIRLPLFVNINYPAQVNVYRSNTNDTLERPFWERMPACDFRVKVHKVESYVLVRTTHFSLFNAILDESPPEVFQNISAEKGGVVKVDQVPGVEVDFPIGSLKTDVVASVKVLCSELPSKLRTNLGAEDALASPTVVLKPHGANFNKPVLVRLPIPDYTKIVQRFGSHAQLQVWHSPTSDNEPILWQLHDLESQLCSDDEENYYMVVSMTHFSWLTTLWGSIKGQLSSAGMGMGSFYSGGTVSMKCQAWMLDSENSNKFGLVIICHRSDASMQDVGNYGKNVGGSLKPVCISPGGDILIKLAKSEYFDADTAAGEDASLEKTEANYKGGEFDVQFACKFKEQQPTNRDIFGKVFVKRLIDGREEKLFEFNLIQKNDEPDQPSEDPWMAASLRELAEVHGITNDDNWKRFARALHFSQNDIRTRFSRSQDPFGAIISQYRLRGGQHEDFLLTLNQVGRELRIGETAEETPTTSSSGSWREMLGFGGWWGAGRIASSTPPSTITRPFADENIPGPSGLQSNSRKRMCNTCEANEGDPKRTRLNTSLASSQDMIRQLHIGTSVPPTPPSSYSFPLLPTCTPPGTPPHIPTMAYGGASSPAVSYGGASTPVMSYRAANRPAVSYHANTPAVSYGQSSPRHSPPLCSTIQGPTNLSLVGSMGPVMSTSPSRSLRYSNTPLTESQYGSIPTTSQQSLPNPSNAGAALDEHLMRKDSAEVTQQQLYRIAPLIQTQWVKVARYIWDNEAAESEIKDIKEQCNSPEEQATQMLLQWREKCPDACTRGCLYSALCDLNLKTIAKKCGQIYTRS